MMKVNGLREDNYFWVTFFSFLIYFAFTLTIVLGFGFYLFKYKVFVQTGFGIFTLVLFAWGLVQIAMAFFFSMIMADSNFSGILGYAGTFYLIGAALINNTLIYVPPGNIPLIYHFSPLITFQRCLQYIVLACQKGHCYNSFKQVPSQDSEFALCIYLLYIQAIVIAGCAWYVNQIAPQSSYGGGKKWNFLCSRTRKRAVPNSMQYNFDEIGDLEDARESNNLPVYDYDVALEDQDSKDERNFIYNLDKADYYKYPLIIKDLRKVFPLPDGLSEKVVIRNLTLKLKKGEILGLLGSNGAGKTTLLSILTGLVEPTKGNAWVAGFDIKNQTGAV
mmetsp:Transcript_41784/g.63813  ORF Transcript_41784/g.63813 Transcript_41784/m.63813 type:complete len:333 (+) Transcript_41784:1381-2379(+)